MTLTQTVHPNYIVLHAGKQGMHSSEVWSLALGLKKLAREP